MVECTKEKVHFWATFAAFLVVTFVYWVFALVTANSRHLDYAAVILLRACVAVATLVLVDDLCKVCLARYRTLTQLPAEERDRPLERRYAVMSAISMVNAAGIYVCQWAFTAVAIGVWVHTDTTRTAWRFIEVYFFVLAHILLLLMPGFYAAIRRIRHALQREPETETETETDP